MEFKKKTIIWEDNSEPPKDYIWIKSDNKAYEFDYTDRQWKEVNIFPSGDSSSCPELEDVTITENGTTVAEDGKGFSSVTVNVPAGSSESWLDGFNYDGAEVPIAYAWDQESYHVPTTIVDKNDVTDLNWFDNNHNAMIFALYNSTATSADLANSIGWIYEYGSVFDSYISNQSSVGRTDDGYLGTVTIDGIDYKYLIYE